MWEMFRIKKITNVRVVQTQGVAVNNGNAATGGVNHNAGYAPASWNLKLTSDKNMLNYHYICNNDNIHAMLTGQMEYYHVRTGYGAEQENATEQALYQWFCDWLNGMDFEHMSEMDRAKEIQKVLQARSYDTQYADSSHSKRNSQYSVLVEGKGICIANYIIQVDGTAYLGSNNIFNLITKAEYSGYTAFNWFN